MFENDPLMQAIMASSPAPNAGTTGLESLFSWLDPAISNPMAGSGSPSMLQGLHNSVGQPQIGDMITSVGYGQAAPGTPSFMDRLLDPQFQQGLSTIGGLLEAGTGIGNIYLGGKALGENRRQNRFMQDAWRSGFNNSVDEYNTRLQDRQRSRLASGGQSSGGYQSLEDYMSANKLKRV